jgi:hypothetical protein
VTRDRSPRRAQRVPDTNGRRHWPYPVVALLLIVSAILQHGRSDHHHTHPGQPGDGCERASRTHLFSNDLGLGMTQPRPTRFGRPRWRPPALRSQTLAPEFEARTQGFAFPFQVQIHTQQRGGKFSRSLVRTVSRNCVSCLLSVIGASLQLSRYVLTVSGHS